MPTRRRVPAATAGSPSTYALTGMARSLSRVGAGGTGGSLPGVSDGRPLPRRVRSPLRSHPAGRGPGAAPPSGRARRCGGERPRGRRRLRDWFGQPRADVRAPGGRRAADAAAAELVRRTWRLLGDESRLRPAGAPRLPSRDRRRLHVVPQRLSARPVQDDGTGPKFTGALPEGIDCQRCHGPGQAHLSMRWPPATSPAAVAPSSTRARSIVSGSSRSACNATSSRRAVRCRSSSAASAGRRMSYVPGTPLGGHVPLLRPRPAAAAARPARRQVRDCRRSLPTGEVGLLPGQPDDLPHLPRPARCAARRRGGDSTTPRPVRAAIRPCTPPAPLGSLAPDHARPASTATCRAAGPRTPSTW